ncbi:hypothetical protein KKF64_00545 [Patescibacteria group bacterium]|nr:hypothetical protein [Patescibacteria group bacterium]
MMRLYQLTAAPNLEANDEVMNHCNFVGFLNDDPSEPIDDGDHQTIEAAQFEHGAHALIEPISMATCQRAFEGHEPWSIDS